MITRGSIVRIFTSVSWWICPDKHKNKFAYSVILTKLRRQLLGYWDQFVLNNHCYCCWCTGPSETMPLPQLTRNYRVWGYILRTFIWCILCLFSSSNINIWLTHFVVYVFSLNKHFIWPWFFSIQKILTLINEKCMIHQIRYPSNL